MRKDIYVVQKNEQEGEDLIKWCKEQGLPINRFKLSFTQEWKYFTYSKDGISGFFKNFNYSFTKDKTEVTIEEFKRLQLESLGKTEELSILPDEGCFYGTKEQQTAFAKFLCTRPFCRPDGKITKDEAIGIGWNKTSHWWLKTKNSQKTEYSFQQLKAFIKNVEEISYDFKPGDWAKTKSGKTNPFELQADNFPIKNGLLAGFKVEDLVKCEKPSSDLKPGDYITVTEEVISKELKMIGKITEVRSDKDESNIRGKANFIQVNNKEFYLNNLWCYKDNKKRNYRKSTEEEIQWLNECIKQNKFVEWNEKFNDSVQQNIISSRNHGVIQITEEQEAKQVVEFLKSKGLIDDNIGWDKNKNWLHVYWKYNKFQFLYGCADTNYENLTKQEVGIIENKPKYEVVHCKTQEEWDFVCDKNNKLNAKKDFPTFNTFNLHNKGWEGLEHFTKKYGDNLKILSFEEWCNKEGVTMEETYYIKVSNQEQLDELIQHFNQLGYENNNGKTTFKETFFIVYPLIKQFQLLGCNFDYPQKQWEFKKSKSLVGRWVKRIAYDIYNESNVNIGEYDLIERDNGFNWYLKTFMNCEKQHLLKDFELMPEGFDPSQVKKPNIDFSELNLEDWLRETKKLNLSQEQLQDHIDYKKTCSSTVYRQLKGNILEKKTEILWNEWNLKEKIPQKLTNKFKIWLETKEEKEAFINFYDGTFFSRDSKAYFWDGYSISHQYENKKYFLNHSYPEVSFQDLGLNKPGVGGETIVISTPDEWGQNRYVMEIDPYKLPETQLLIKHKNSQINTEVKNESSVKTNLKQKSKKILF